MALLWKNLIFKSLQKGGRSQIKEETRQALFAEIHRKGWGLAKRQGLLAKQSKRMNLSIFHWNFKQTIRGLERTEFQRRYEPSLVLVFVTEER